MCLVSSGAPLSRSAYLPRFFAHIRFQVQIIQYLRNQVEQGLMTREQAQERLNLLRTSAAYAFQSSSTSSASQSTQLAGPQGIHKNFVEMPVQQLSGIYGQLMRSVEEGERNLNATASTGGETDMQRQALRARLDGQKQLLINIRDLINLKRQGYARFLT